MYKMTTYQQTLNGSVGLQYADITKQHNGICVLLGYSGEVADSYIIDCSIRANNNAIRLNLTQAETVVVHIAEFYQ